jgi:hypothetical protein
MRGRTGSGCCTGRLGTGRCRATGCRCWPDGLTWTSARRMRASPRAIRSWSTRSTGLTRCWRGFSPRRGSRGSRRGHGRRTPRITGCSSRSCGSAGSTGTRRTPMTCWTGSPGGAADRSQGGSGAASGSGSWPRCGCCMSGRKRNGTSRAVRCWYTRCGCGTAAQAQSNGIPRRPGEHPAARTHAGCGQPGQPRRSRAHPARQIGRPHRRRRTRLR